MSFETQKHSSLATNITFYDSCTNSNFEIFGQESDLHYLFSPTRFLCVFHPGYIVNNAPTILPPFHTQAQLKTKIFQLDGFSNFLRYGATVFGACGELRLKLDGVTHLCL